MENIFEFLCGLLQSKSQTRPSFLAPSKSYTLVFNVTMISRTDRSEL